MNREQALNYAREASRLSREANELIASGKFLEGHELMRQAVEAGRTSRRYLNQEKIQKALQLFEEQAPG
ncbi:MAG: hypothetical protein KME64_12325 [Scytonematopsis contorta HA4267-MV1]|jgi:hypothetical protein|nr:hypothetical protein [Scytonematopsis contorta HA4267-MV1]